MRGLIRRLLADRRGSTAIEFALLGPALVAMLLGVFQIGMGMQNYNALRSVSADVARYAMVNYETGNKLQDSQLSAYCQSVATHAPYNLVTEHLINCNVSAANSRVAGITEKTIYLQYEVPTLLGMIGVHKVMIDYQRPVFLVT